MTVHVVPRRYKVDEQVKVTYKFRYPAWMVGFVSNVYEIEEIDDTKVGFPYKLKGIQYWFSEGELLPPGDTVHTPTRPVSSAVVVAGPPPKPFDYEGMFK